MHGVRMPEGRVWGFLRNVPQDLQRRLGMPPVCSDPDCGLWGMQLPVLDSVLLSCRRRTPSSTRSRPVDPGRRERRGQPPFVGGPVLSTAAAKHGPDHPPVEGQGRAGKENRRSRSQSRTGKSEGERAPAEYRGHHRRGRSPAGLDDPVPGSGKEPKLVGPDGCPGHRGAPRHQRAATPGPHP
jgi:hypothetical protein